MNYFTIPEQDIVNKKYDSPIKFIKDYIEMYTKQAKVIYKVYTEDIQYFKIYEQSLLNYLINKIGEKNIDLSEFIEIEDLIQEFYSKEFYDVDFLHCTNLTYIKGVAILLDKVDTEINQHNFLNINTLYFYTKSNINVYNLLIKKCIRYIKINKESLIVYNDEFLIHLSEVFKEMNKININLSNIDNKLSTICNSPKLLKRVSISANILGNFRVTNYTKKDFLYLLLKKIQFIISDIPNEKKYVIITNLIGDFILKGICDEKDLEEYKKYSQILI